MQWGLLQALGFSMDPHGYISLSDKLGSVAGLRLASLLGFAAFQASVEPPRPGVVKALERLGIQSPAPIPMGGSGMLVLLGASHNQPVSGMSVPEFLAQSQVALRSASADPIVEEGSFQPLPSFAAAAQWARSVTPGSWILELSLPQLAPTRYALTALRDHLSILVVVADDSGEVEVQQYMAPLADPKRPHTDISPISMQQSLPSPDPLNYPSYRQTGPAPLGMWALRDLELGQRYLASGAEVPLLHLEHLLRGRCLDPLLGCIAGYELIRTGRQRWYATPGSLRFSIHPEISVLRDMLRYFDALPDVHILAGLCEPEQQEAHFQRALERGLPLFSDGLRALQRRARNPGNRWFDEASRGLLPGSLWTAWVDGAQAVRS